MAENYPTPTTPPESVPPDSGELLRVTFWHATNEIDVVPEAQVTQYPEFPNSEFNPTPPGIKIHTAPTPDMARRAFREFCQLYLAAGCGAHTVMELGNAIEKPYPFAWTMVQRLQTVLPETMVTVDMCEKAVRKRAVTFGNVAVAEIKRTMSPEECEARSAHRCKPSEKAAEKHEYEVEYRKTRAAAALITVLNSREATKRQLGGYNHVAITFDSTPMSLDLMTREGRLAFRYLEGLKKIKHYFPHEDDQRLIATRDVQAQVWDAMTIDERLDYATNLQRLGGRSGAAISHALAHIRGAFHNLKPDGEHAITQPNGSNTILFSNPDVKLAFSRKPPVETGVLPPLVIPPFPEKIMSLLPKKRLEIPHYGVSGPRRDRSRT